MDLSDELCLNIQNLSSNVLSLHIKDGYFKIMNETCFLLLQFTIPKELKFVGNISS